MLGNDKNNKNENNFEYISLQEATKLCNYSQEYLSLRARTGKLKSMKLGRNWVTTKEWVAEYANKVEEYNESINNNSKKSEPEKIISDKPARHASQLAGVAGREQILVSPPKNLPVISSSKIKINFGTLRPAFAMALGFVLIIAGGVFGKESFLKTYDDVARGAQNLVSNMATVSDDVFTATVNYKDALASIRDNFSSVDKNIEQKIGNALLFLGESYSSADKNLEQKIGKSLYGAKNIFGQKLTETITETKQNIKNIAAGFKSETIRLARTIGEPFAKTYHSIARIYKFIISPWREGAIVTTTDKEDPIQKVIVERVEVSKVVQPVTEITRETIQQVTKIDDAALAQVRANMTYLEGEIGKRLYAPGGVVSQTIYVTEPVSSPKIYQENNDIVLQTAGSGNVILSAATGLQLYGKQVVVESTSLLNPLIYLASNTRIGGDTTITGAGNISGTLGVGGNATMSGDLAVSGNFTLGGSQTLSGNLIVNGTATSTFAGPIVITSSTDPQLRLAYDSANYTNFGTNSSGDLTITPSGADLNITGNLLVTGSTGIATSSPRYKLDVWGDFSVGTSTDTNTPLLYVDSGNGGQIGIGTTTLSNNFLTIGTSTSLFVIASNGYVSIATTSPRYALDVWGDLSVGTSTNSNTPLLYVDSGNGYGSVGIGTTTPTGLFTVGTSTPAFFVTNDGYLGGIASNLTLARIGTSTYSTLQDMQTQFHSAGWVAGGTITDNGDGTISITAGMGWVRGGSSATSTLYFFDWPALTNQAITDGTERFILVNYNSGTPSVTLSASETWDRYTSFPIGYAVRDGSTIHITYQRMQVGDHASSMVTRMWETDHVERDNFNGGLMIGGTGARNITVSAGTLWMGLSDYAISAIDTSAANTFDRYFRNGAGGWTKQTGTSSWDNIHYDNNSGTLATLTDAYYSTQYFYLETDGDLASVFGQNQYTTLALAEEDTAPSTIPIRLQKQSILIGRVIFQKSLTASGNASSTESAFSTIFQGSLVTDHGDLAGLTDDDHTQYALLAGRDSGQTLIGSGIANNVLSLQANSAAAGNTLTSQAINFKVGDSGATTAMTIINSGNVGIATTSPDTKLDVWGSFQVATTTGKLLTVNYSTGYTGIATSTPSANLSVAGNIMGSGNIVLYGSATSTMSGPLEIASNIRTAGNIYPSADITYMLGSSNARWANIYAATTTIGGTITIDTDDVRASGLMTISATDMRLSASVGDISATSSNDIYFATNNIERLRINSLGQVGIGTTTLSGTLLTVGTTTPSLVVANNGYVGIGTTTPSRSLYIVHDQSSGGITLDRNSATTRKSQIAFAQSGVYKWAIGIDPNEDNSQKFIIYDNEALATRLLIDSAGNIGIGNTIPTSKLTVNGGSAAISTNGSATTTISSGVSTFAGGMIVNASSTFNHNLTVGTSTALFVDSGNGYVGIGTTTPAAKLSVVGSVIIDNSGDTQELIFKEDSVIKGSIQWVSGRGFEIQGGSGVPLTFGSNLATNQMVLDTSGNLGIGTTTPSAPLHVLKVGSNGVYSPVLKVASDGSQTPLFFYANSNTFGGVIKADSGGNMVFTSGAGDLVLGTGADGATTEGNNTILNIKNGAPNNSLYIAASGNVGLGTANPTSKLTVSGGSLAISSTGSATTTISSGVSTFAGGFIVNASSTLNHNLTVGTSTALFVDSGNGYVGIGTASPTQKLQVSGNISTNAGAGNVYYGGAWVSDVVSTGLSLFGTNSTNAGFYTKTGGVFQLVSAIGSVSTDTMTLSQGNVGIGNTNPTSRLTVNGGDMVVSSNGSATTTISSGVSKFAGGFISQASSTISHNLSVGTSTALFVDSGNGNVGIGTVANSMGKLNIQPATDGETNLFLSQQNTATAGWGFNADNSGYLNIFRDTLATTKLTIYYLTGNVGISNANPTSKLTVNGGDFAISSNGSATTTISSATSTLAGGLIVDTNSLYVMADTGYVGIGTATPGAPLSFSTSLGSAGDANRIRLYEDGTNVWGLGMSNGLMHIRSGDYGNIAFYTSADTAAPSERMRITSGGNLGIGNTAPTSKLTVNGGDMVVSSTGAATTTISSATSTFAHGLIVDTSTLYVMADNNRIGIATTTPRYTLDVWGSLAVGTTTSPILFVDSGATGNAQSITVGADMSVGNIMVASSSGAITFADMVVEASAGNGTEESYAFQIDSNPILTVYSESDGLGSIKNKGVLIGTSTYSGLLTVGTSTPDLIVKNNGYVGIGTASPSAKLTVNATNSDGLWVTTNGAMQIAHFENTSANPVLLRMTNNSSNFFDIQNNTDNSLSIDYNDSVKFAMTSAGDIGIGTTTPEGKFTVDAAGTTDILVKSAGSARASIDFYSAAKQFSIGTGYTEAGDFAIKDETNSAYRFFINSSGNVGIGTSTPGAKFVISAGNSNGLVISDSNTDAVELKTDSNGDGAIYVNDNAGTRKIQLYGEDGGDTYFNAGNIGIGLTNPQTSLTVGSVSAGTGEATFKGSIQIQDDGANDPAKAGGLEFKSASASNGYGWSIAAPDLLNNNTPLVFSSRAGSAAWTEYMRITNTGNLGLATTTPRYKLDVWGSLAVGTTTTPLLFVDSGNGYVGIGTSTPYAKLTINESDDFAFGSFNETVLDNMEGTLYWTRSVSISTSTESTIVKTGGQSLKLTASSTEDEVVRKQFSSNQDLSSYERISFWIYADRLATSTATSTQLLSFSYHDTGGTETTSTINFQQEDRWQYQEIPLTATAADKDAINYIAFRTDFGGIEDINFYIDQIRAYNSTERSSEMFVGKDGTLTIMGRGGVEIGRADGSTNLPGIKVDSAVVEFNQPVSVNTGGDVGINYDLQFLNTGASYITSEGPLWIQAGDPNHADNLYLTTGGTGDVVVDLSTTSQSFIVAGTNKYLDVTYAGVVGIGETSPLAFGDFNSQIVDNMEGSVLEWLSSDSTNVTTSTESTIVKMGSQALKITASGSSEDDRVKKTLSPSQDWSAFERLGFWIYADRIATSTATTTQLISFAYHDTGGTETTSTISIQQANRWQYQEIALTSTAADKNAVDYAQFRIDFGTTGAINFYVDHIRLYDDDERSADLFVGKDGSLAVTGRGSVELYAPQAGAGTLPGVRVDAAVVEIGAPLSVNVGGDVGMNNDLQFLSTGLSQITSEGPMKIMAGDSNHSENLTLTTGGTGDVIIELNASSTSFMVMHSFAASSTVPFIINSEANSTTTPEMDSAGILFQVISDYSSDENTVFSIDASGNAYADRGYHTPAADVAENYYVQDESIKAGDVVCLSENTSLTVEKCSQSYQDNLIGVISTQPALWMGNDMLGARPVALNGRVPVKISLENGPVAIGDSLTSASSTPGAAMKATGSGKILGYALEPFDGSSTSSDMIFAFINLQDRDSGSLTVTENSEGNIEVKTQTQNGLAMLFSIDAQGYMVVDKIKTNQLCVGSVCVAEADFVRVFGAGLVAPSGGDTPADATSTATTTEPVVIPDLPNSTIDSGPSATTTDTSATFLFQSNRADSIFTCQIDSDSWAGCESPKTYSDLTIGNHQFGVYALNPSGESEPTASTYNWQILEPIVEPIVEPAATSTATTTEP